MIYYEHGKWGVQFIFQLRGAVFLKALVWSVPSSLAAIALHLAKDRLEFEIDEDSATGTKFTMTFGSFLMILGFMVVFRSNQAYSRYWEGASIVQRVRGEWFNTICSLMAFCSRKQEDAEKVKAFQHLIVRFMSLLFATALSTISENESYKVISQSGLDKGTVEYLAQHVPDVREGRCEVLLFWLQRIVVDNHISGVLPIPPPILSRVFQELSGGVVNISAARKMNELPFPFHYAQVLAILLMAFTIGCPFASVYMMSTWYGACLAVFLNVTVLWSVNYLSVEIESPFGEDANDLPLHSEMQRMNSMLEMLWKSQAHNTPSYKSTLPHVEFEALADVTTSFRRSSSLKHQSNPGYPIDDGLPRDDMGHIITNSREYLLQHGQQAPGELAPINLPGTPSATCEQRATERESIGQSGLLVTNANQRHGRSSSSDSISRRDAEGFTSVLPQPENVTRTYQGQTPTPASLLVVVSAPDSKLDGAVVSTKGHVVLSAPRSEIDGALLDTGDPVKQESRQSWQSLK